MSRSGWQENHGANVGSYGSTFILGPDSFYDGLSFDAARVRLQPIASLVSQNLSDSGLPKEKQETPTSIPRAPGPCSAAEKINTSQQYWLHFIGFTLL